MESAVAANQFIAKVAASLADETFVRLGLSSPVADDDSPRRIIGRLVRIRGAAQLSLTLRHATRDVTQNIPVRDAATWLCSQLPGVFHSALLETTTRDWQFILSADGDARLVDHKPRTKQSPPREHDRKTSGILDTSAADWLRGLDVMDRDGRLRASMADKHRQINRYLELLSHLIADTGWDADTARNSPLRFADMGCGKGYLTFGLWHLFRRVRKQPVEVVGIESRPDLVATTNRLAQRIGADGLQFVTGEIATTPLDAVDGLIALHACNTATDDAIRRGIGLGARLIIVSPCCHKELRPQLAQPEPFAGALRHGVMQERMAEWLTDGLRALFLEWAGYDTRIMEFVSSEHTPKNLMIAAVRKREPFIDDASRDRIRQLKKFFGIKQHALDPLLDNAPRKV